MAKRKKSSRGGGDRPQWKRNTVAAMMVLVLAAVLASRLGIVSWPELADRANFRLESISAEDKSTSREERWTPETEAVVLEAKKTSPSIAPSGDWVPEIHAKHFFHGYPTGTPVTNDLIIRDIYALSNNDARKFADWVCFRLDKSTVTGESISERDWESDPWLSEEETLEPDDYKGANRALKVDRGHQAPLASFRGTDDWRETNYLSNITPQRSDLNQGAWVALESAIRDLAGRSDDPVFVMTGPLFERAMEPMPGADEPHEVPSGYWCIVCQEEESRRDRRIDCGAFLFDQETPRDADFMDFQVAIDEIEMRCGLDFLRDLPDDEEADIESLINRHWAEQSLSR